MPHSFLRWDVSESQACDTDDDPSQAYLGSTGPMTGLSAVFKPRSVAIVGATDRDGAVGKTVVENLKASQALKKNFRMYPVNPMRKDCCGLPCYSSVEVCPSPVDLVVIVTPAKTVKEIIESCGRAGVLAVIVISAGFKEIGPEGLKHENEIVELVRKYHIRLIGPNCLGVVSPDWGLNATFAATDALPGNIAFMSQSGALCTAVLDWSLMENVGFSAFVSIGCMADVNWGDLIDYLGNDAQTQSILIYMESIGDAAHFLSAARSVAMHKPIIVIKAGQTEAAAQAAASHTGSLAGSHDAFVAAMKRAGVMVVDTIGELFDCALVLGKQPRPRGQNLLIITNAGGPGVLATDATVLSGATVCKLESKTIDTLNSFLPGSWSHSNPVDILGDASADLYARTMEVALADQNADGVLVVLSPQSVTNSTGTARKVIEAYDKMRLDGTLTKPIMCSWMGGREVSEGFELLNQSNIPTFSHPDAGARTFGKIWGNTKDIKLMYQAPGVEVDAFCDTAQREKAIGIMKVARDQGRGLLTEDESKQVLKAFGIPVAESFVCSSCEEAVKAGNDIGYPCVVKINSETLTHKSDIGGVKLNIKSDEGVRDAWNSIKASVDKIGPEHFHGVSVQPMIKLDGGIELIVGSLVDSQFGPLVLFGAGGCMVEIFKDTTLGIPPLNPTLAQILMEDTKIYKALKGGHGQRFPGVNVAAINKVLCKFSQMVCELSEFMAECDINPLLALPNQLVALDARVVLRKRDQKIPRLAIRPYPQNYIFKQSFEGKPMTIRPTHSNDISALIDFHCKLSKETVRQRYLRDLPLEERLTQQRIVSVAAADYARMIALAAIDDLSNEIMGIVRLTRWPTRPETAEMRMAVRDDMQGRGLGAILLGAAIRVSKLENIKSLQALVFKDSVLLLKLAAKCGFKQEPLPSNPTLIQCKLEVQ